MKESLLILEDCAREQAKENIESGEPQEAILTMDTPNGLVSFPLVYYLLVSEEEFQDSLRALLQGYSAFGYVLSAEAWLAREEVTAKLAEDGDVTDLPLDDRDNIVYILTVERGKSVRHSFAVIVPKPGGRVVKEYTTIVDTEEGYQMDGSAVLDW